MSVLALDLGGTKLASARFSENAELLDTHSVPLSGRKGDEVGALIIDQIRRLCSAASEKVKAIGVSVPGISRRGTGTVWAPNIEGWDNYPLHQVISEAFPGMGVTIDSDRACSILGEQWKGNARDCRNAIFIAVGTGIGAGILSDGSVIRGADDIAGAVGWLALKKPYKQEYIPCGCFEYYASGEGIARYTEALLEADPGYQGMLRRVLRPVTAHNVFDAHAEGDPLAGKVLNECVSLWGMASANLVSIFNPDKIIFGGGIFGPAQKFIPAIYEEAKRWGQPISMQQVRFEPSALKGHAAIYGAGFLATQQISTTGTL